MKILVIWRLLTVGGVNAGWRNRALYFKKHGIELDFLYKKDLGGLHIMEDVATVYLTDDEEKIIQILNNNHYDAVIVVDTPDAYSWIEKSNYSGPVIVEARTPELIKLRRHLKTFKGIDPLGIIVPSHYQKRLVTILTNGIPIYPIYNGVDTSFFKALPMNEIHINNDPILPEGKKIVGWIGRLDKRKNWRQLLEIAKVIKDERNDIEFWVVGGAKSVERDLFEQKWREEQLTDIVKWFPVIPYHEMPHMYAKIRESGGCTLATTKTESFGNTFIESMVCGVPVVTSNMMPMSELIEDGKTGMLFQQNKIEDAVKKIYNILDNPELHKQMSQNAVIHVQNHFSITIVAEQYIRLLKELIHQYNTAKQSEVNNQNGSY